MRYGFLSIVLFAAGCSYTGHEKEYGELKERAAKTGAWTPSPEGSSEELGKKLLRILEPDAAVDLSGPAELETLVRLALARNPELRARVKRLEAAVEQVPQAASAPEPELELAVTVEDFFEMFASFMIALFQPVLFPGKLEAASKAALERAWEEWERLREESLKIRAEVARDYAMLFASEQAVRILRENLKLLEQLETIARSRFEARQVPQQDVLKVKLRALETENQILRMTRERREAEARLNAMIGRRDMNRIGIANIVEEPGEAGDFAAHLATALEKRPEVAALTHGLRRGVADLRLAELEIWPDLKPGIEYEYLNGGGHELTPSLSIMLPFLRPARIAAMRAQMRAMLGEAWHMYEAGRVEIAREVASSHARMIETRESLLLYRDKLRPQAKRTYEAALAGYRAGEVDFLTTIDALLDQQMIEEQYYRLVAEHLTAREDLRRAVGGF